MDSASEDVIKMLITNLIFVNTKQISELVKMHFKLDTFSIAGVPYFIRKFDSIYRNYFLKYGPKETVYIACEV